MFMLFTWQKRLAARMPRSLKVLLKAPLPSRVPSQYKNTFDGSVVLVVIQSRDSSSNVESSSIRKVRILHCV